MRSLTKEQYGALSNAGVKHHLEECPNHPIYYEALAQALHMGWSEFQLRSGKTDGVDGHVYTILASRKSTIQGGRVEYASLAEWTLQSKPSSPIEHRVPLFFGDSNRFYALFPRAKERWFMLLRHRALDWLLTLVILGVVAQYGLLGDMGPLPILIGCAVYVFMRIIMRKLVMRLWWKRNAVAQAIDTALSQRLAPAE